MQLKELNMILTITLNPSLDFLYTRETFELGKTNKFENPTIMVGGKGINAARTSKILGSKVLALTVFAGENGKTVKTLLQKENMPILSYEIEGQTRNAITIMHDNETQTEITEMGPIITEEDQTFLYTLLQDTYDKYPEIDVICLCGSANTLDESIYKKLIYFIKHHLNHKIKILADISGEKLKVVLQSNSTPFLIKPNLDEFSELVGKKQLQKADIFKYLDHPYFRNINCLLVSCGAQGAVVKYGKTIYDIHIPTIKAINPTGSGDATIGGIAFGLDTDQDIPTCLQLGMASGIANALEKKVGFINKSKVSSLLNKIQLIEQ